MAPSVPPSNERFVTPVECSETLLLDTTDPQILGAVDNTLATSPPPSPRHVPQLQSQQSLPSSVLRSEPRGLRSRSSTIDSTGSSSSNSPTLDRIEYLEVAKKVKRNGTNYYVVDVYKRRRGSLQRASESAYSATVASRMSDTAMFDFMLKEREPDYQLEHRFAAFRDLKHALQSVASRHAGQCAHCRTLLAYLSHSDNQLWTVKRLVKSSASRQELLSKFINGVLSLTSESDAKNRVCLANDDVTEMLESFLRRRYDGSLGII